MDSMIATPIKKKKKTMLMAESYLSNILPCDIIFDILLRLPTKPLVRFRCISQSWNKLRTDPIFIRLRFLKSKKHNSRKTRVMLLRDYALCSLDYIYANEVFATYMISYPTKSDVHITSILGSCKGLLLVEMAFTYLYLLNPSTKECMEVPRFEEDKKSASYGLGYNRYTKDYVVIALFQSKAAIYSLRNVSWRKIPDIPYKYDGWRREVEFVNEAFHWLACGEYQAVIAYDIRGETIRLVPLPTIVYKRVYKKVLVERGQLCLLQFSDQGYALWAMKKYGAENSWKKLFTIDIVFLPLLHVQDILCLMDNGLVLLKDNYGRLLSYDPKHRTHCYIRSNVSQAKSCMVYK